MREIKFRGMDDNGHWHFGDLSTSKHFPPQIVEGGPYTRFFFVDPDTVGQFTGLLDSNGNEIYEGDILEGNRGYCVKNGVRTDFIFHSVVFWYKSGFMHKGPGIFSDSFNNVTVIGNVHDNPDNPELLRGESNA